MDLLSRNRALLDNVKASNFFTPLAVMDISKTKKKRPLFYLDDKYLGFGIVSGTLSGADETSVKRLSQFFAANWPKETIIQINLFSSPDVKKYTKAYRDSHNGSNPVLNSLAERRSQYFDQAAKGVIDKRSNVKLRDFKVIITVKIPIPSWPLKEKDELEINEYIDQTIYTMSALKLYDDKYNQFLDENSLCNIMQSILNWDEDAYWKNTDKPRSYDPENYLRESFLDPGNRIHRKDETDLQVGGKHVGVMSVKDYPQLHCINDMVRLIGDTTYGMEGGLTTNFLMTLTVIIPDAEKERSKLESKKQKNNYQALSQMSKWVPKLLDIKADYDAITEFLDEGDKLVKMNFTCAIFADTRQELDSTCSGIKSYWDGFDFRFIKDSYFALPLFLNQLPFNTEHKIMKKTFRYRTMTTRQVAHFAPLVSEWRSVSAPALMFNTRLGQPIFVDLFDSSTSFSACIIAESGSGKSFLTNYLATSYMGMENSQGDAARVWIIDSGYSYQRLNKMLKGSYIDYDDKNLKMNPFEFVSDFSDSSDMLLRIITVMAGPTDGLNDLQSAEVRKCLGEQYEIHGKTLTIDHIAEDLMDDDDPEIVRVGRQLYPFTSKGEYGGYFNGKSNVDLNSSQFTVVELASLKSKPLLQRAVLFIIMYSITEAMATMDKNTRKLIILDEAWQMLAGSPEVAKFMENLYRTVRKQGGAACVVTQSINDLYGSDSGIAIAENSPNKFFLGQTKTSIQRARAEGKITLDDYGFELLENVATQKGYYSEMLIMKGTDYGVARFVVDRFTQLLCTTDPIEVGYLEKIEKSTDCGPDEAVNTYMEYEEQGKLDQVHLDFGKQAA